jgi:hypothetical protein
LTERATGDAAFRGKHRGELLALAVRLVRARVPGEVRPLEGVPDEIADAGILLEDGEIGVEELLGLEGDLEAREGHFAALVKEGQALHVPQRPLVDAAAFSLDVADQVHDDLFALAAHADVHAAAPVQQLRAGGHVAAQHDGCVGEGLPQREAELLRVGVGRRHDGADRDQAGLPLPEEAQDLLERGPQSVDVVEIRIVARGAQGLDERHRPERGVVRRDGAYGGGAEDDVHLFLL